MMDSELGGLGWVFINTSRRRGLRGFRGGVPGVTMGIWVITKRSVRDVIRFRGGLIGRSVGRGRTLGLSL